VSDTRSPFRLLHSRAWIGREVSKVGMASTNGALYYRAKNTWNARHTHVTQDNSTQSTDGRSSRHSLFRRLSVRYVWLFQDDLKLVPLPVFVCLSSSPIWTDVIQTYGTFTLNLVTFRPIVKYQVHSNHWPVGCLGAVSTSVGRIPTKRQPVQLQTHITTRYDFLPPSFNVSRSSIVDRWYKENSSKPPSNR
jgi:hypothetical protein